MGLPEPTKAFEVTMTPNFHGLFLDPKHHLATSTFAGVRVLAEVPLFTRLCSKGPRRYLVCSLLQQMQSMMAVTDDPILLAGVEPSGLYVITKVSGTSKSSIHALQCRQQRGPCLHVLTHTRLPAR